MPQFFHNILYMHVTSKTT